MFKKIIYLNLKVFYAWDVLEQFLEWGSKINKGNEKFRYKHIKKIIHVRIPYLLMRYHFTLLKNPVSDNAHHAELVHYC